MIWTAISFIPRKLWGVLAAIGGVAVTFMAVFFAGRKSQQVQDALDDVEDYIETRERIDDVEIDDDPNVVRDWLRQRGKSGGDL